MGWDCDSLENTKAGEIVFGVIGDLVGVSLLLLMTVVEVRKLRGTGSRDRSNTEEAYHLERPQGAAKI